MFEYFNPYRIFKINSNLQKIVFFCFILVLSIGLIEALFLSPEDYLQKDSVRIMYVHVPAAWISLGIFSLIALLSVSIFLFKNKNLILISKSLAPSGMLFTLIALVTGSIWGKPTWGTWWAWDARITSMLILLILYILYLLTFRIFENEDKSNKISSIIAIFGAINIPIIKFSVDWWNTLHQPASVIKLSGPTIHSSMLIPLLVTALGFFFYFLVVLIIRMRSEITNEKIKNLSFTE